jgi:hypothetical protein
VSPDNIYRIFTVKQQDRHSRTVTLKVITGTDGSSPSEPPVPAFVCRA